MHGLASKVIKFPDGTGRLRQKIFLSGNGGSENYQWAVRNCSGIHENQQLFGSLQFSSVR